MMNDAVEQSLVLTADALVRLQHVLSGLRVYPERMRTNLDLTGGLIMAESIMMALAELIGRLQAHAIVHHAAATAVDTGQAFADVPAHDPTISTVLTADQIAGLLDPAAPRRAQFNHRPRDRCSRPACHLKTSHRELTTGAATRSRTSARSFGRSRDRDIGAARATKSTAPFGVEFGRCAAHLRRCSVSREAGAAAPRSRGHWAPGGR
jgi:hypothetical protein